MSTPGRRRAERRGDPVLPDPPEKTRMLRAAGTVGASTLLSRALGYARDMLVAWYFGAGLSTDAFIAAFRIPNLVRRLLGEGALSAAFVPVFSGILLRQGRREAFAMARSALRLWAAALLAAVAVCLAAAPWIMRLLAYGFSPDAHKFGLTVLLSRVMAPYILFAGLVALCMGILNPLGHFAAPALAPVMLNLAMIGSVLLLAPRLPGGVDPVLALAVGVVLGGVLQLCLQVPFILGRGLYRRGPTPWLHPGVARTAALMLPAVFGSAVYQVNLLATTLFASLLAEGSLACLYFADRLIQLPLGLFAFSAATAALPSFSRQASDGDLPELKAALSRLLRWVLFVILPSMAGLLVLREPIVALLFERGAFDAAAGRLTAEVLLYYTFGLWAVGGSGVVAQAFFALQDTRTPLKAGAASVGANLILMALLTGPMGAAGLALAVSLSSALNLALLAWALRRKIGPLGGAAILRSFARSGLCSALMAGGVWIVARWVGPAGPRGPLDLLWVLGAGIASGAALYFGASLALKSPEMRVLLGWVRARI